jgi:curli production assembly/transport component CsgG
MKKTLLSLAVVAVLTGCATGSALREKMTGEQFDTPKIEESKFLKKDANKLLPPEGGPLPVAVYGFRDLTGQRKSQPLIASLSSAVTQGAENYLIKALQDVGEARWFTVLERVGLENLIKERQMIRQMREQYQGRDAKALPPMMFAGIIMEGGIVGYDSNTLTGGSGVRLFGIGASTQYQSDTVTVTLRTVSVATGEILTTVTITKTVLSYMDKITLLRFVGDGTNLGANANALEGEIGGSINESINKAIDVAVQAAVVQTINEGARKGHWGFKQAKVEMPLPVIPLPVIPTPEPIPVIEEKKDVVVQAQTPQTPATAKESTAPVPQQSDGGETLEGNKKESKPVEQPKVETGLKPNSKLEGIKPPVDLFGARVLKEDSYVYKEANENSQRTWLLKKGTELTIIAPGPEGWHKVSDSEKRSGFVKQDVLISKP